MELKLIVSGYAFEMLFKVIAKLCLHCPAIDAFVRDVKYNRVYLKLTISVVIPRIKLALLDNQFFRKNESSANRQAIVYYIQLKP